MIRAGRQHLVRTMTDLAATAGVSLGRFRNAKMRHKPGHPPPISSPSSRTLLWDGEQTDAFYAGEDVPALPHEDHEDDLLDRNEVAELLGIKVRTWNRYEDLPGMERRPEPAATVAGVDHWRRGDVLTWKANRPGVGSGGGRPKGSADLVPVEEIQPRAAELLAADPGISAAVVADRIGVHQDAAQRALAAARADAVEAALREDAESTAEQLQQRLGFPLWAVRRALETVAARRRAEQARPYLEGVREGLAAAGIEVGDLAVRARPGNVAAAVLELGSAAPVRLLVWDERYGWRTAPSRPKLGRAESTPPEGPGIRYLGTGVAPPADDLCEHLQAQFADRRTGRRRPQSLRDVAVDDLAEHLPPAGR